MTSTERVRKFRAENPGYDAKRVAAERARWFADKSCLWCGSRERLEIDHVDPALKISHSVFSWEAARREAELAKCRVLCKACHRKRTNEQISKPVRHGTVTWYTGHKCRCDLCRAAMSAWKAGRRALKSAALRAETQ